MPYSIIQVYPNPTPEGTIYNMHWRLLSSGQEILAKGLRGQYLYLNKKTNTLIIRLGTRESSVRMALPLPPINSLPLLYQRFFQKIIHTNPEINSP